MKILADKYGAIYVDGKWYNDMTEEEKKNLWLRCVDYMRTHYTENAARMIAAVVPCYLGKWEEGKGHEVEI